MLSGIGSIDNVSGSARLSASVSFSISTARSVTMPKRSSDDSHAVSVVMSRVLVPAIAHVALVRQRGAGDQMDERLGRAGVEAGQREALAAIQAQHVHAKRLRAAVRS